MALILSLCACTPQVPDEGTTDLVPITATEGFLNNNGGEIYYRVIGTGPPLLIIHGGPGLDHSYLLPHMDDLANEFRLIYYDQRTSGRSSFEVDTTSISMTGFLSDVDALRRELGYDEISILGHSWGGLIAMNYGIKYPERISKMILLNSMSPDSEFRTRENEILSKRTTSKDSLELAEIRSSQAYANFDHHAFEDLFRVLFRKEFFNREKVVELNLDFPEDFYARSRKLQYLGNDLASFNLYDSLESFDFPVLLLYGRHDPIGSLEGPRMQKAIHGSILIQLDSCGHFPFIERKIEFRNSVIGFLTEKEGA